MPSTPINHQETVSHLHRVKRKDSGPEFDFQNGFQLDDREHPFAKRVCRRSDLQGDIVQSPGGFEVDSDVSFHQQDNVPEGTNLEDTFPAMETDSDTKYVHNYATGNGNGLHPQQQHQLPFPGRADVAYSTTKCYCRPSWEAASDVRLMSAFHFF